MSFPIREIECFLRRDMAAAVLAVAFLLVPGAMAQSEATAPFSRFTPILDRNPFGPPPAPEPTNSVTDAANILPPPEDLYIIPPGLENVRVTLLSRFNGVPAAGFTDAESNKPYYLLEGQEFDDFKLVKVDLDKAMIRLRRGGSETDLPLWINPATTNQADVTTFGMTAAQRAEAGMGAASTPGTTLSARPVSTPVRRAMAPEEQKRREELLARRDEARKRREEERKKQQEELEKMTPAEREQRLRDINVDIIINNEGPPLPIELNDRDMQKLADAGFDVPGFKAKEDKGGEKGKEAAKAPPPEEGKETAK